MPFAVFAIILSAQLWLVAIAGTDVPFMDQWDVEGHWLYPAFQEGSLHLADLFRAHNEHHIVWTHLLNLFLFRANGNQWDPLVQLVAGAVLHAVCAALLAVSLGRTLDLASRWMMAFAIIMVGLPLAGWHNALWGFQSQVYFVLLFALLAFELLADTSCSRGQRMLGWVMIFFSLLAMGPGCLVPVALLGLTVLQLTESRRLDSAWLWPSVPIVGLLLVAVALQVRVPENEAMHARSWWQFITVAARVLAWPHVGQPLAAIAMNLPLLVMVIGRAGGRLRAVNGENFVLLLSGWAVAVALATAYARGGSAELDAGVPSRYVDLIVLLPLANLWCMIVLVGVTTPMRRTSRKLVAMGWVIFLFVGWLGLSAQMLRGVILPRARDPLAPVRLAVAFQARGDPAVFAGQPRLLVPHPNLASVQRVLIDPRMKGALPPSFQPDRPMGPLSRAARNLLGR